MTSLAQPHKKYTARSRCNNCGHSYANFRAARNGLWRGCPECGSFDCDLRVPHVTVCTSDVVVAALVHGIEGGAVCH